MQLVKNECTDTNQMDATITVKNQSITWKNFQETINSVIGEKSTKADFQAWRTNGLAAGS